MIDRRIKPLFYRSKFVRSFVLLFIMEMSVHSKEDILERLRQLGPELRELGVERLGLFGSFQRGDSHDKSDVDLLVEFVPGRKNFESFMNVNFRLEDILQRRVELITKESLSRHIGPISKPPETDAGATLILRTKAIPTRIHTGHL